MSVLELNSIWKSFGKEAVLLGVDWKAEKGELIALMGVNGAGKTTVLRIMSGLVGPESGEVRIQDEILTRDAVPLRRQFYFLGDEPALFPDESAIGNLAIMAKLWGLEGGEFEARAAEWMEAFEILPLREKPIAKLSRGQRYKVALVILATLRPPLWLLDEPFASGMDAQGLRMLRKMIREATAAGTTVVFSTQLIEMVRDFADRVTVLNGGVVLHDGPVPELERKAHEGDIYLAKLMD